MKTWTAPEFVLIGRKGSGKTSFLESFFGFRLVQGDDDLHRPLHINFFNNQNHETPFITIRDDSSGSRRREKNSQISPEDLPKELSSRLSKNSSSPVYLKIESKYVFDMEFIEAPSLPDAPPSGSAEENDEVNAIIAELCAETSRTLLFFENAQDWETSTIVSLAQQYDKTLGRSMFFFTKFNFLIHEFPTFREINAFLGGAPQNVRAFFFSCLGNAARDSASDSSHFQKRISQQVSLDAKLLDGLQCDRRYFPAIGVRMVRNLLLQTIWKGYQNTLPTVVREFKAARGKLEQKSNSAMQQIASLESPYSLRNMANHYCSEFVQTVVKLIVGGIEGNTQRSGQTLEEERVLSGVPNWADALFEQFSVAKDVQKKSIRGFDSRLLGKQQLERLLAEFKFAIKQVNFGQVTLDDIGNAQGIREFNDHAWVSSDLVRRFAKIVFAPMLDTLFLRLEYVIKRLAEIADSIVEDKAENPQAQPVVSYGFQAQPVAQISMREFPLFKFHVKTLFFDFAERTLELTRERCEEELANTYLIDLQHGDNPLTSAKAKARDPAKYREEVLAITKNAFDSLRARIGQSITMRCYEFVLGAIETSSGEIERHLSKIDDAKLKDFFEVETNKVRFQNISRQLEEQLKNFTEDEIKLSQGTSHFSVFRLQ